MRLLPDGPDGHQPWCDVQAHTDGDCASATLDVGGLVTHHDATGAYIDSRVAVVTLTASGCLEQAARFLALAQWLLAVGRPQPVDETVDRHADAPHPKVEGAATTGTTGPASA